MQSRRYKAHDKHDKWYETGYGKTEQQGPDRQMHVDLSVKNWDYDKRSIYSHIYDVIPYKKWYVAAYGL